MTPAERAAVLALWMALLVRHWHQDSLALAAAGALRITATLNIVLGDASLAGEGSAVVLTSGALDITLDAATLGAAGALAIAGELAQTLADATLAAAAHVQNGALSPQHAAWLEGLARLHGLIDPLTVSDTARSDGSVVQTVSQVGATVTITTTAAPSGAPAVSALSEQQALWLERLARIHGLIDPLTVSDSERGDGTVQQTLASAAGITTVALQ